MPLEDKLNKINIVLMDIDGTMIRSNSDSFGNIVHQLRRLKPAGVRFSVATGRTLHGSQRVLTELLAVRMKMPPMIAYNGGVVAWPEDSAVIDRKPIPKEVFLWLLSLVRPTPAVPLVYTCRDTWGAQPVEAVYGEANLFYHPERDFNGMPIRWVPKLSEISCEDVTAVLLAPPSDEVDLTATERTVAKELGQQLRVTRSGSGYIEVAHCESTKKNAMTILARQYGRSLSHIMAIGDNFNDLEMLQAAGVGVAVANAPTEVKAVADYVCQHEASDGVVEIIRELLASRRASRRRATLLRHKEGQHGHPGST